MTSISHLFRLIAISLLFLHFLACDSEVNKNNSLDSTLNESFISPYYPKKSITQADSIFELYTGLNPDANKLKLIVADSMQDLINDDISIKRKYKEVYFVAPPLLRSEEDTLRYVSQFKNQLDGTTFVTYDSLNQVVSYIAGFQMLSMGSNSTISSTTTKVDTVSKRKTKKLNLKNFAEIKKLAIFDYNQKIQQPHELYKYFLWAHFYYKYNDFNTSPPSGGIQRWLIDFSVIDAIDISLADVITSEKKSSISLRFLKSNYEIEYQGNYRNNGYISVPAMDNLYTNEWKYIVLDICKDLEIESTYFRNEVLFVLFLKSQYGENVIKEMCKWYIDHNQGTMLFVSFINKTYDQKLDYKQLQKIFNNWLDNQTKTYSPISNDN